MFVFFCQSSRTNGRWRAIINSNKRLFFCERSDKHMEKNERITIGESDYVKTVLYVYPHLKSFQEAVRQSARNKAALSYKKRDAFAAACEIAEDSVHSSLILWAFRGKIKFESRLALFYSYFISSSNCFASAFSVSRIDTSITIHSAVTTTPPTAPTISSLFPNAGIITIIDTGSINHPIFRHSFPQYK